MVSELWQRDWGIGSSPALAVDGNQVYIGWMGGTPNLLLWDIYFALSRDAGKTFSPSVRLSKRTREGEFAAGPQLLAGNNGHVYVGWMQVLGGPPPSPRDMYFVRSTDGGHTFDKTLNLSNNPQAHNLGPVMAVADDNIYVAWMSARGGNKILFSRSTDAGETFSTPRDIARDPSGTASSPRIAVIEKGTLPDPCNTEDIVYLAWHDSRTGPSEIFFSVSLDSGVTFSEPQNVSNTFSLTSGLRLVVAGNNVYLTWMVNRARNWDVFFVRGQLDLDDKLPLTQ